MDIKFSIIIPLYNKASFIGATLTSVLKQTHTGFEVIVIDDGSTDDSLAVARTFQNEKISIYSKENGGVSAARNFGIKKAGYDYIAFLDADDEWLPDYLQTIADLITQYPDCGMYATAQKTITKQEALIRNLPSAKSDTFIVKDFCRNVGLFQTSAICIRKTVAESVGEFSVKSSRGEDLDYWLRVACKFQIAYHNTPKTIYYQITENNLTRTYRSYTDSFPYWEWAGYEYSNRLSLYKLLNTMLLKLIRKAIMHRKIYDATFLVLKLKLF